MNFLLVVSKKALSMGIQFYVASLIGKDLVSKANKLKEHIESNRSK